MARPDKQPSLLARLIAMLSIIGLMAIWALIPGKTIDRVYQSERSQIASLAGKNSDQWLHAQTATLVADLIKGIAAVPGVEKQSALKHWINERLYVSAMWLYLMVYRGYALLMWMLLGVPLMLAAGADGVWVREIRKESFTSQSPIRHMIGVHFFKLVSILLVFWLLVPAPLPAIVAPGVVAFVALSLWLWVSNLQKRL